MRWKSLWLCVVAVACGGPVQRDAGVVDAGAFDAGPTDVVDAGVNDGGAIDAGAADASIDAGARDAGAPDAGQPDAGSRDAGPPDAGPQGDGGLTFLRIMAANLTSGSIQSYDAGHGARIMQGVQPDLVLIQEFNVGANGPAELRGFVDATFGTQFQYFREPNGNIPNGIISRWPILEAGSWDDPRTNDRDIAWARIDVPGPIDLWAVSVHLLTSTATVRDSQASDLVTLVQGSVPGGAYLAIGGDLNTDNRNEPCFTTLSAVVSTSAPFPVDQDGGGGTNTTRSRPYDHVLVNDELRARQVPTVIGMNRFDAGLVVDTRVYTPLSDLAPALQSDSAAPNMQHMGVVKDFALP